MARKCVGVSDGGQKRAERSEMEKETTKKQNKEEKEETEKERRQQGVDFVEVVQGSEQTAYGKGEKRRKGEKKDVRGGVFGFSF